jgi:hypothetical protein
MNYFILAVFSLIAGVILLRRSRHTASSSDWTEEAIAKLQKGFSAAYSIASSSSAPKSLKCSVLRGFRPDPSRTDSIRLALALRTREASADAPAEALPVYDELNTELQAEIMKLEELSRTIRLRGLLMAFILALVSPVLVQISPKLLFRSVSGSQELTLFAASLVLAAGFGGVQFKTWKHRISFLLFILSALLISADVSQFLLV